MASLALMQRELRLRSEEDISMRRRCNSKTVYMNISYMAEENNCKCSSSDSEPDSLVTPRKFGKSSRSLSADVSNATPATARSWSFSKSAVLEGHDAVASLSPRCGSKMKEVAEDDSGLDWVRQSDWCYGDEDDEDDVQPASLSEARKETPRPAEMNEAASAAPAVRRRDEVVAALWRLLPARCHQCMTSARGGA
eukprot:TRINITY_DN13918_c0_g1_i1.p1 TRINITY_DN13918_c0_g1~~TRINITY_DN13918_c0_g1_i1.p1  ORF type:complete len:219 (+),score=40.13 TRINITY_DN13918_c0_g1_i1:73-657(+)